MKKRTLWIVLLCLALMLSGCGAGTEAGLEQERLADTSGTAVQVKQAEASPSDVEAAETSEAEPSAETLPGGVHALVRRAGDRRRDRTPRF